MKTRTLVLALMLVLGAVIVAAPGAAAISCKWNGAGHTCGTGDLRVAGEDILYDTEILCYGNC